MDEKEKRQFKRELKLTIVPILATLGITGFSFVIVQPIPKMSSSIASQVLVNTIQLDGVLFGFTAVMFGLFYGKRILKEKEIHLSSLMITGFLCYYFSLGFAFFFLGDQLRDNIILAPAFIAVFGGLLSSVFVVLALVREEDN